MMKFGKFAVLVIMAFTLMIFAFISCDKQTASTGGNGSAKSFDKSKIAKYLLDKEPATYDIKADINLDNKIKILGIDYSPKTLLPGKPYTVTFYFKVLSNMQKDYQFFGHFEPADGNQFRGKLDHFVLDGKYPTSAWQVGDIIKDTFKSTMAAEFPAKKGVIWAGFFKGNKRMPVAKESLNKADKGGRVKLGVLAVAEGRDTRGVLTVYKAKGKINIDGKLDEADWTAASETGQFVSVDGGRKQKPKTTAKMLWDDKYLYVAFNCEDSDIWTNYKKQDDPLYKEETIEIMIDADNSKSTYYEMQVSPANVVYDAYFPERRKNRDLAWNSNLISKVSLDGTLNKRSDKDKGWIVEIAIPLNEIKDAKSTPPKNGESWRLNFYRMERPEKRGTVASMWSPTLVGDFHILDRFGTITFSSTFASDKTAKANSGKVNNKKKPNPNTFKLKPVDGSKAKRLINK